MKNVFFSLLDFKKYSQKIKQIMKIGIRISFVLLLFSVLLLSLYIQFNNPPILYTIGSILFKTFSMYIAIFIIYGISFNKIVSDLK